MTQGERSERVIDLQGVAHELTEIALALPYGWGVLLEADGQVRIVPPEVGHLTSGSGGRSTVVGQRHRVVL